MMMPFKFDTIETRNGLYDALSDYHFNCSLNTQFNVINTTHTPRTHFVSTRSHFWFDSNSIYLM